MAGTENLQESISSQQSIVDVPLFPDLWTPDPRQLFGEYARMPNTTQSYRRGIVYNLVGNLRPIFNIPRGEEKSAA